MNGITKDVELTLKTAGAKTALSGVLNLDNWDGQTAIESLNKVCFDVHKGADGVSKTWSDVKLDIRFSSMK